MAFIRFQPETKSQGFAELLRIRGGAFHCLPDDIYDVSETDIVRLKERGISFEFVTSGIVKLNGRQQSTDARTGTHS